MTALFPIMLATAVGASPGIQCPLPLIRPAATDDPFDYLSAVADSLSWAHEARKELLNVEHGMTPTEVFSAINRAEQDLGCSAENLAPFSQSSDEIIRKASDSQRAAFDMVRLTLRASADRVVKDLDDASAGRLPAAGAGTRAKEEADGQVASENAWQTLVLAVIAAEYVLPAFVDGKPTGRFRITRAQRRSLQRKIEKIFGPSVRTPKAGQVYLVYAAADLYDFLAKKEWRSSDDASGPSPVSPGTGVSHAGKAEK